MPDIFVVIARIFNPLEYSIVPKIQKTRKYTISKSVFCIFDLASVAYHNDDLLVWFWLLSPC